MGHPLTETVAAIVAAHRSGHMTPAQTVARSYQRIRDYNDPAVFISLRDEKAAIAEAEALTAKDASAMPLLGGNAARIFGDYDRSIHEMTEAVRTARTFVHVEFYILSLDHTTAGFFDALEDAVQRGVQVLAHGCAVVDHRVDQVLKGELGALLVAGIQCDACRETAASAFALDADAGGIKPELAGVRVQPDEHRVDILQRRWVWCFRRQAMIHRVDGASKLRREQPVLHILHFGGAHHEAAAMDM